MISKKDKYLAAAQKFLERGQPEKALAEFGRVVAEDPKDTRTWLKMAEIHAKRGAVDDATSIYLKTADLYTEQGFFQKAVAVFKNVLKLNPGYVQGHFKLADLYRQMGMLQDSLNQLEQAAAILQKAGRTAEALDAVRQVVDLQPDNVGHRIRLAEGLVQAGRTDEAVREFGLAAEQLKVQGRGDEYLKVAERLLFYRPEDLPLARSLAEAYIARNNARFALPKLQACFKADPRDPATLALLAQAFEQLGQTPKAVQVLKELARLCHDTGHTVERNEAVRRALALDGADGEVRQLASKFGLMGAPSRAASAAPASASTSLPTPTVSAPRTSSAPRGEVPHEPPGARPAHRLPREGTAAIDRASLDADTDDVKRTIAEADVFVKYGLLDRAAEHIRRVFETDAKHVGAREKLVAILVQLGRISDAVAELEAVAEHLARAHPDEAAEFARRALALDPRSVRASSLLRAIEAGTPAPEPIEAPADDLSEPDLEMEMEVETGASREARGSEAKAPTPAPEEPEGDDEIIEIEGEGEGDRRTPDPDGFGDASEPIPGSLGVSVEVETSGLLGEGVPSGEDEGGLVDAADELPASEFEEAQRTAAGAFSGEEPEMPTDGGVIDDAPMEEDFHAPATVFASTATAAALEMPDSPAGELAADLEQIDFYVQQGMVDEARAALVELAERNPSHPLVVEKLAEVGPGLGLGGAEVGDAHELGAVPQESPRAGVRPRAVVADGDEADVSTHRDLGIAYREMGLVDAAIQEFQYLVEDPRHEVFALQAIGECHESKGSLTDAVIHYKRALNGSVRTPQEETLLYYLLGNVYERLQDEKEALFFFEKVVRRDAKFRDAGSRVSVLKARTAPRPAGGNGNGNAPAGAAAESGELRDELDAAFDSLFGDDDAKPPGPKGGN